MSSTQATARFSQKASFSRNWLPIFISLGLLGWASSSVARPLQSEEAKKFPPDQVAPVAAKDSQSKMISMKEVGQHNSLQKGIWVAIQGEIYDVTNFIDAHPGGKNIIIKNAGKDVTELYTPVHPADAISENMNSLKHMGQVDPSTIIVQQAGKGETEKDQKRREALENLPLVGSLLNLDDFEVRKFDIIGRIV